MPSPVYPNPCLWSDRRRISNIRHDAWLNTLQLPRHLIPYLLLGLRFFQHHRSRTIHEHQHICKACLETEENLPNDATLAQKGSMSLLSRRCSTHQSSTPMVRRTRRKELQDLQEHRPITRELRVAETGVQTVDDDIGFAVRRGARREPADVEDFQEL